MRAWGGLRFGLGRQMRKWVVALALVLASVTPFTWPVKDAAQYDALAWDLAQGAGFASCVRTPGYPALLALIYLVAGHSYGAVKIVQVALHGLNTWLASSVGEAAYDRRAGLVAGLLVAVYPPFVGYTGRLLTETLTITLLLAAVLLLMKRQFVAGGLLVGISILVKPALLLWPVCLAVVLALRGRVKQGLIVLAVAGLVILPWAARNYVVFGQPVVACFAGYNLMAGTYEREGLPESFRSAWWADPAGKDPEAVRLAWGRIKADPLGWLGLMPRKVLRFWLPDGAWLGNWRGRLLIGLQVALLALALIGLRRRPASFAVPLSLVIYMVAVHLVVLSGPRFNLPVMPCVLVLGGSALVRPRIAARNRGGMVMADITDDLDAVVAELKSAKDDMDAFTVAVNSIQVQISNATDALEDIGTRLTAIDEQLEAISLDV